MSWWVIINPAAGGRDSVVQRARDALAARHIEAEINVSQSPDHLRWLVDEGVAGGRRRFVAVGGDGTANMVADALMRHEWAEPPLLGILPAGSGCDFIRTFAISQRLEEAADHLVDDSTYRVDIGHLTGAWGDRYFLNVAEAGLGARVLAIADRLPVGLGGFRYKAAVWPALIRSPIASVELVAGKRTYEGPAVMIVFANAQFFGGGMNVAPRATLVDGVLDIQVFTGPKRLAVTLQPRVTRGTHLSHPSVRRFSAGEFTLRTDPPWPVEADGEYLGEGVVQGSVLPGALDVKI